MPNTWPSFNSRPMRRSSAGSIMSRMLARTWVLLCVGTSVSSVAAHPFVLRHTFPAPPSVQSRYGQAVAVGDDKAVIGYAYDNSPITKAGSVSIYDVNSAEKLAAIYPIRPEIDGHFYKVATDGDTLAIGSGGLGFNANDPIGSVFLFDLSSGHLQAELTSPSDSIILNSRALAMHNGLAAVGGSLAAGVDDFENTLLPQVQLIYDATTGEHRATLEPNSRRFALDGFGASVAIDSDNVLVGAAPRGYLNGQAYLFDVTSGAQKMVLRPEGTGYDSYLFGISSALHRDVALVGAPGDDDLGANSGSAYLFDVNSGQQLMKLTAPDGVAQSLFGQAVALTDKYAVVGAPGRGGGGPPIDGKVYVFDVTTGAVIATLSSPDIRPYSYFGDAISIDGNQLLISASGHKTAYLYQIVPEASSFALATLASCAAATLRPRSIRL